MTLAWRDEFRWIPVLGYVLAADAGYAAFSLLHLVDPVGFGVWPLVLLGFLASAVTIVGGYILGAGYKRGVWRL